MSEAVNLDVCGFYNYNLVRVHGGCARGKDVHSKNFVHPGWAIQGAKVALVRLEELVAHGVDVNAQNVRGETPLHWACLKAHTHVVEQLLTAAADPLVRATAGRLLLVSTPWGCLRLVHAVRWAARCPRRFRVRRI